MISISTLLTLINTILLVIFGVISFKKNYVIMSSDEFNTISQFIEEHSEEEEASRELAGGTGCSVGFGADYLEDSEEEE